MDPTQADPGTTILRLMFERMQIDEEWATRIERGFTWWPHDLAQRVWATPIAEQEGVATCHIHIETDLTTGAIDDNATLETLVWMNRSAMLSALVLVDGRIRLHGAVAVNAGNIPFASELALHAMALQLVESSFAADTLAEKGCGRRDVSGHPSAGPRTEPDDMLGLGAVYADSGNPTPAIDFVRLATSEQRCWVAATGDATGFTCEIALAPESAPAIVELVKRQQGLGTALFQATTTESHPAIGAGLLAAVRMPGEPNDGPRAANALNAARMTIPASHALGAWWHSAEYGLTCSAFYPALAFRNAKGDWNFHLFESIVWHAAWSARWVTQLLSPGDAS